VPRTLWLASLLALTAVPPSCSSPPPAFPGAEGFGAGTPGGRGGRLIEVTNLNDRGPGSFRAALEAPGSRVVVFRVGGTIDLDSSLEIVNPYITIAGQTAPGDGITLRNSPASAKTPLKVKTHDVVIRYLRSRPGSNPHEIGTLDAITIADNSGDVYDVIIDHSSFSWATDEVMQVYYAAHDVTIQWSIIAEGLDCATHIEGGVRQCHSMGLLLGEVGSRDFSVHHNLFAHNRYRNPRVKTMGLVDVVNNVVYNSGSGEGWRAPTDVDGDRGVVPANFVANFLKPGPDTGAAEWYIDTKEVVRIYAEGNIVPKAVTHPHSIGMLVDARHPAPPITTFSASDAYARVLEQAGASRGLGCDGHPYPRRDGVDARIVKDVEQGTGRIIDSPSQVGGWPDLAGGAPCADSDHDGMPDAFEARFGLDPADPSDGPEDSDGDGYTNVEEFLNSTAPVAGVDGGPGP
jgi:pectate lyase